jgi:serine/threonine protein kinase
MRDLIGRTLGHYRIVEKIGEGGMGVVYRAHDKRLDRDVAVKVPPEEVADDPDRLHRFEREAKSLAPLSHPKIPTVHLFDTVASCTSFKPIPARHCTDSTENGRSTFRWANGYPYPQTVEMTRRIS